MKKLMLILFTIYCANFYLYAQTVIGTAPPVINDSVINSFKVNANEFYFKGLWNLNSVTFLENYLHQLNLPSNGSLKILDIQNDTPTYHYWFKFQQFHNDIKVENRTVLFVEKGGELLSISGSLENNFKESGGSFISESEARLLAIDYAHDELGIDSFAWEIADMENMYKEIYEDSTFTFYPDSLERVYTAAVDDPTTAAMFVMAWAVPIQGKIDGDNYTIYIDAESGNVVKHVSNVFECGQIGTANIHYNGPRSINTHYRGGLYNDYSLQHCTMGGSHLKTCRSFSYGTPVVLLNNSTTWGNNHQNYTSVHWWASMSKEYYNQIHNRKFMNKDEEIIPIFQYRNYAASKADSAYSAAFHSTRLGKECKIFIPALEHTDITYGTLDVLGHEYTHGIIANTSKLRDSKDAKSLNEGFSDIFGNLIELYTLGTVNWSLREWDPSRDMQDPHNTNNPKIFQGTYWQYYDPNNSIDKDSKAFHNNATVLGHWFYLLQSHIGIDKATRITYRTAMHYANTITDYPQVRRLSIEAASHLFGECSMETRWTTEAWNQVNVAPQAISACLSFTGPGPSFCTTELNKVVNYTFYVTSNVANVAILSLSASNAVYSYNGNAITIREFTAQPVVITAVVFIPGVGTKVVTYPLYFRNCPVGPLYMYGYNGMYTLWPADKYYRAPDVEGMSYRKSSLQRPIGILNVYPNPADHKITVQVESDYIENNLEVQIIDVLGRIMKMVPLKNGGQIDVSDIPTGVYSLKTSVTNNKGERSQYSIKFIKE